jgi:cell division protein FtsA
MHPKNNNQNIVTVIDIGTSKIVTIAGRMDDKGMPEILGLSRTDTKGFGRGKVFNKEELVKAVRFTVDEVQKQAGIVISEAYVGVAGLRINCSQSITFIIRNLTDDEISEGDTESLLEKAFLTNILRGEEIISIIPQSYIIDGEKGIRSPVGCCGLRFELVYLIMTDPTSTMSQIKQSIDLSGIAVKEIILASVASASSVLTPDEIEVGVLLADIGANSTDIVVYYDGQMKHLAVIQIFATQTRISGIIDAILYELDTSGYRNKLASGIVITGGGAQLNDLPQLLKLRTGLEVRIGCPCIKVDSDNQFNVNNPIYSSSVGLLLNGFEKIKSAIDPL